MQGNGLREALDTTCSVYVSHVSECMWGSVPASPPPPPNPHLPCTLASTPNRDAASGGQEMP